MQLLKAKLKLSEVITKKVYTTTPEETVEAASRTMAQHHISALPVLDSQNKVVGLISTEDIAKLRGR